ncbi:MAG: hypothetical protein CFH40_00766 [Alphaproteobacteria bacterium MarineAlpha10_Bin3]|jgi:2-dehydropantoate 2-reductase|nr:MAG: hypothetical protein CFH40_00766 [Alphaproteobacteria bacterium MarineAlpha10_Bin3]PPR73451.1 MAG: hypothetical protein CFH09_00766 [Alphaproteobacteria bacterium MarineAlpha4_Bin1]
MRFIAFGAGGVGGYFGGRLARAGQDVTFIARRAHLDAIRARGLRLRTPDGEITVDPVQVTDDLSTLSPPDYLLFAVKLFDTQAVAEACRPIVGPRTAVVSLQNGVEAVDILSGVFGAARVMGGTARIAAVISEPGVIAQTGKFAILNFGEQDGSRSERGLALEAACLNAGFDARLLDNIDADIWQKFILLATLSGMTSLTRLPNGPLRKTPATRALVETCMAEVAAVGRARGIALPDDVVASVMALWDGLPAEMVASMAHDLKAGKPLELDHLSGAVVRLGRSLGVPTPTHAFIHAALQPYVNGAPPE